jgi:hypothetical protein
MRRAVLKQLSRSTVSLLFCLISTPLVRPQIQSGPKPKTTCNQDGTLCVKTDVEQPVVVNPLYFEVRVRCSQQIKLGWELRDDSGKVLDQDPDGRLAFLVNKVSVSERTLGIRDFALAPAKTSHGNLVLHATTYSIVGGENHLLPELSIPVRLDLRTSDVTYAVPAGDEFSDAVIASVESDSAHPIPMRAELRWRTTTLLYVRPAMLGGAAAEASARAYPGQGPWHVINYSNAQGNAHLTILGDGWAGVTYYLTGLNYLLEKTTQHEAGVRRVVFDRNPDFGQ